MSKEIGKRLRELRQHLGLNQSDFGEKLGVTQANVSYYEQSGTMPIQVLDNLFVVFDVNLAWLLRGKGSMFNTSPLPNANEKQIVEQLEQKIKDYENEIKRLTREREIYLNTIEALSKP